MSLLVCLFLNDKRHNGLTDQAQFFCGNSQDQGRVHGTSELEETNSGTFFYENAPILKKNPPKFEND